METRFKPAGLRLGRGLVFHVAPGNVPVNFAYSLAAGLLSGNANVVRLPSAPYPQVEIIAHAFDSALSSPDHEALRDHVTLVRYDRDDAAMTGALSARCDVRVIWGGDDTIREIRRAPLPARSTDLTFADRYSMCVIDADSYLHGDDAASIAEGFFNDTYLFDQNACTAPHLVVWLGSDDAVQRAKQRFWSTLHGLVSSRYSLQPISAVDKCSAAYRFAAASDGVHIEQGADNLITRIEVDHLAPGIENWRSTCGYFVEYHAGSLDEILPVVTRQYQTLSYIGVDADVLAQLVLSHGAAGIDRIVPVGHTLDFSLEWDGYDLVESLSRVVSVS